MKGSRPKKKTSAKRTRATGKKRTVKPVLGNDPFERGAAVRAGPAPLFPPRGEEPATAGRKPAPPEPARAVPPELPARAPSHPAAPPAPPAPEETPAASAPAELSGPLADALRAQLGAIESRVEAAAASAAARLRDLARQEASGQHARDLMEALSRLLPALREKLGSLATLRALFAAPGELDAFGMDRALADRIAPGLDFLYSSWWRVELRSPENVPAHGPVVVVANHGGALVWDALVLRLALQRHPAGPRELRPLLDEHAVKLPVLGSTAVRLGAVPATPGNALQLLGEGQAIGVFPEGSRNARRPWPQRYRVERFGRGGFAKLALRTGAAIVPCAIVGSEEASAPFARPGWLSERLGIPLFTAGAPLPLSLLEVIPLPSRWSLHFGEPIEVRAAGPAAEDLGLALELTERTRAALQQMLDEDVAARRSVYL